jgi:hypothetical protein
MQAPLKPLNPLNPNHKPPELAAPVEPVEEVSFDQSMVRIAMALEAIAYVQEKIAIKSGAMDIEDASYG